tara:strand:- start:684 stop:1661 length:978 start_codon:yes stop_codon:yes gene_type:complete
MNYNNLVISILILLAAGYVYNQFKINQDKDDNLEEINIIKKYLLNENTDINNNKLYNKPIIWIHIDYNINSRKWESFGSRNNTNLNQDYLYLTIMSIIKHCSNYFNIILINDDSFKLLLENWNIDLNYVSNPQKTYLRKLALIKILYKYGGLLIEPSFIMLKSLDKIYKKVLNTKKICVGEFPNNSINSHAIKTMPSTNFIGCIKNCPKMKEFDNYLAILFTNDYSDEINIEDQINKWLFNETQSNNINYIDGKYIGTKDNKNNILQLEELLGTSRLDINEKAYCIYIPRNDILKRNSYSYYASLSNKEVLEANVNISKYLLLTL